MQSTSYKVWIKDPYKIFLLATLKRSANFCQNVLTPSELLLAKTTDSISELKFIFKKAAERI